MNGKKKKRAVKSDVYTTNLRLPHALASQVKESAKENKRSINSEIEYVLTNEYK